jgi:hypothetical protein
VIVTAFHSSGSATIIRVSGVIRPEGSSDLRSHPYNADSVRLTDVLFASAASPRSSRSGCLALLVLVSGFVGGSADLAGRVPGMCLLDRRVAGLWNGLACQLAFGAPVPGLGCHARWRPCQDLGGAATGRNALALALAVRGEGLLDCAGWAAAVGRAVPGEDYLRGQRGERLQRGQGDRLIVVEHPGT